MFVLAEVFSSISSSTVKDRNSGGSLTLLTMTVTPISSSTESSAFPSPSTPSVTCNDNS